MFQGLSLDQAPPISVPFRFFLSVPIFAILIGVMFFYYPMELLENRYSNITIAMVHLFTLGILSMTIFGAMQQMMPVLAGAVIKKPNLFANIIHTTLVLGTICFAAYFLFDYAYVFEIAMVCLGISFLTFFTVSIRLLFKVKYLTSTVSAMRLFSITGIITAILGLIIANNHLQSDIGTFHYAFVNSHIAFGLIGFAVLLIMGVSFQVIPMFYVAKNFPKVVQNKFPIILLGSLFILTLFLFLDIDIYFLKLIISIVCIVFSLYGIDSLNNRKRPVFDVTLWYWKLSLSMFIFAMLNWFFIPQDSYFILGILFGFGFLYSLLQGMIYKIIPFLAWFHLTSKGYFTVPTIRDFIKEDYIKLHFFMYFTSLVFFLLSSILSEQFIYIAAALFILSNIVFLINSIVAILKKTKKERSKTGKERSLEEDW